MRPGEAGVTTERLYRRLPEFYRLDDEVQGQYPLLTYLSWVGDQASDVENLVTRLRTDMADPMKADVKWLPWLAQMVGLDFHFDPDEHRYGLAWKFVPQPWSAIHTWRDFEYVVMPEAGLSNIELREAIRDASVGWRAGTKGAIASAASSQLVGSRYVRVYDHSTDATNGIGIGTQWDVLVVTATSETPSPSAVLDAVSRKKAKPAGVKLWHRSYEATWSVLVAAYPAWTGWHGAHDWATLQETGLNA